MATKDQQINQLMDMGFGNNRVVRALQATEFKVKLFEIHRLEGKFISELATSKVLFLGCRTSYGVVACSC